MLVEEQNSYNFGLKMDLKKEFCSLTNRNCSLATEKTEMPIHELTHASVKGRGGWRMRRRECEMVGEIVKVGRLFIGCLG